MKLDEARIRFSGFSEKVRTDKEGSNQFSKTNFAMKRGVCRHVPPGLRYGEGRPNVGGHQITVDLLCAVCHPERMVSLGDTESRSMVV